MFDALDPRMTVFALANGIDMEKGDGYRRLEWFKRDRSYNCPIDGGGAVSRRVARDTQPVVRE